MVRVAFGGISHETNVLATAALGLTTLEKFRPLKGDHVLRLQRLKSYMAGFLDVAEELGWERIGLLYGQTEPSGTIADAAFEQMRDELCDRLRASLPVDAVCLEVHGAGVAESYRDIENTLARAVRAVVGPTVPIVGAFDLHGNISVECAAAFDYMCPVMEYPHIDTYERGVEAARMIPRLLSGLRPVTHLEPVPILLPLSMMCTQPGFPAYEMNQYMLSLERRPGVLNCSVFHGFPWADVPFVGTTVIATTDGDAAMAQAVAKEAASWVWQHRERFQLNVSDDGLPRGGDDPTRTADVHTASSAVAAAMKDERGPVVVNEASDNTGCGASGESTHLLRAMLTAGFEPGEACFGWICDPEVLQQAKEAGAGKRITVSLGGKSDPATDGDPIRATAWVRALTDGRSPATPGSAYCGGDRFLGVTARLLIEGVDVLVNGFRSQCFDESPFLHAGIDVRQRRVVGIKSATHFRAGWQPIASRIITCEAPGWSSNVLANFEHARKSKVVRWPLDAHASYARAKL
eukprot:gnl/TRDRNA2_/TRDRNA2_89125_c0_seq1.p1 gnl/TRDRNA2_/TRDRNA2_89125_c0~~gnl/TRDRNA2_/TRDRNA2_89125_c0_seq1.p1  ORF type:complete len:520 (+),score=82.85 gnl/TRDRNA2_/TRDRNA2_89125_c0_seq1:41-1600(+)